MCFRSRIDGFDSGNSSVSYIRYISDHLRCFVISDTVEETLCFARHVQTDELFPVSSCWLVHQLVVFGLMLKAFHTKEVA